MVESIASKIKEIEAYQRLIKGLNKDESTYYGTRFYKRRMLIERGVVVSRLFFFIRYKKRY